ncbi:alpha/beta-hydrolase [Meira miltonrushii]|uniref:Prolyl endopeptidase n=1 Tax=Meira miltonrushii TaxID=1280837 RepID=A0A316V900_9BASI|nr:alpha/beta-hydrolase [Meira miltonrushii]PWN32663.1 alpha/beta-hydrolase [Meira miltonrushii]
MGNLLAKRSASEVHGPPGVPTEHSQNACQKDENGMTSMQLPCYPKPPSHGGATDTINGIVIEDPWRALEVMESEETKNFIKEQNELSHSYLHSSSRKSFEEIVHSTINHPRSSCPELQGDGFYYWKYNPGEAARDIMVRSRTLELSFGKGPTDKNGPELFFDPSKIPNTSLYSYSWSPSGRYFCAILQESGSDWQTIRTIDTRTIKFVDSTLYKSKFVFGACWVQDFGFIYKRMLNVPLDVHDENADGQFGLFYHTLNTPQTQDVNIWKGTGAEAQLLTVERPYLCTADPKGCNQRRSWLFFDVYRNTNPECEAFLIELPEISSKMPVIIPEDLQKLCFSERRWISRGYGGETKYIGTLSDDRLLFLSTSDGCSIGRVISVSSESFDQTSADGQLSVDLLVPVHQEGYVLQKARLVGDSLLVLVYLRHVCALVTFVDARTGEQLAYSDFESGVSEAGLLPDDEKDSIIPKYSSIKAVLARSDSDDFFMSVETWIEPPFVLRGSFDRKSRKIHLRKAIKANKGRNIPVDVVCKQVFYPSHDGIQIPMFLCHSRSLDLSKPHKTLLHAYGGFAVPMLPHYEPWFMAFVHRLDGILAVACIRGGGEYGRNWHQAAIGLQKTNSFEDYASAARYLHRESLSKPSSTATFGTSNGGTLVMATVNRNPELFQACMADVGIADLIRFPLFTIGRIWQSEYGSPTDPKMTQFLHGISPLHNIDPKDVHPYPALLVTTADNDTRVIPGHSLKYLAEVQTKKAHNLNPFLGRIYIGAGHEANSRSTKERIEEALDRLTFCSLMLRE